MSTTFNFAAIDLGGKIDPAVLPGAGLGLNPPSGVFAVPGDGSARVFFSRDTTKLGAVYTVRASTGQVAHGTSSPVTVPNLPNGTQVTFTAVAHSALHGTSRPSLASDAVTPSATPGTIYYVDPATGSDTFDGLSTARPLKTAGAALAQALKPGDAVLLKRGATFGVAGNVLNPTTPGAANNPITLAAYGEGPRPVFDWGTRITGWQPYTTQVTQPDLLTNGAMETFINANGQTIPASWSAFVGSGGGSISKSTAVKDTGSTAAAAMNFSGGGSQLRIATGTATAGINYTWTTRIATDAAGVTAGANIGLQVRSGDGEDYPFAYLAPDGTWTSDANMNALVVTPTASFATYTLSFTMPVDSPIQVVYRHNTGAGFTVYLDNASLKSTTPAPASPNTYRVPLAAPSSGFNPGMLYRDNAFVEFGLDPNRLPDRAWSYDGTYLYYRQDFGSPATDGVSYVMTGGDQCVVKVLTNYWVVRDLAFRYANGHSVLTSATSINVVMAETYSEYVGSQTRFAAGPNKNAVGVLWLQGTSPTARGNAIYECQTDGIYSSAATNAQVTDNVVVRVQSDGADCFQGQGSTADYVARNFFDQTSTHSGKGCVVLLSPNSTAEDNIVLGGNFGISASASGCTVQRNRIYNVAGRASWASGIYSEAGDINISGCVITNNLLSGCRTGISVSSGTRSNWTIANNTVVDSQNADLSGGSAWTGSVLRDNVFYSPLVAAPVTGNTAGLTQSNNTIGTDPKFIAPERDLYTLQTGSPAKGTGTGGSDRGAALTSFAPGPRVHLRLAP